MPFKGVPRLPPPVPHLGYSQGSGLGAKLRLNLDETWE